MKTWRVWDYDRNLLGEVEATNLGGAMRKARETWPDRLAGDRLFDVVAKKIDATAQDIIDTIRGTPEPSAKR